MLTEIEKAAILEHYQNISKSLPGFRPRAAQKQMIATIANTLSNHQDTQNKDKTSQHIEGESIALIEGPTGVGKSLAYLLAGSILAQTRKKTLIVSSATIALQEQLTYRDLPFLMEHSGLKFTFALAKGRGRYLCPYKLYQLTENHSQQNLLGMDMPTMLWDNKPKPEELSLLNDLSKQFSSRKFNGDRDTWPEKIEDDIWIKVTNDRHGCLKATCPNRAECPFYLARELLDNTDVVVTNHDLLLSDINMGGGVILPNPENSFYCIDEAHHFPKKALNQFAAEHSWNQATWMLERLPLLTSKVAAILDKNENIQLADEAASALHEYLNEWLFHLSETDELAPSESDESTWLWEDGKIPDDLTLLVSNTAISAKSLLKQLYQISDKISAARRDKNQDSILIDRLNNELGIVIVRAEQIDSVWDLIATTTAEGDEPIAKWITSEISGKNDYIFNASPISSAHHLTNNLWRKSAGAILTSATLQSLGSFNLILKQTGLNFLTKTTTLALPSPFNFEAQSELYLPPLITDPKNSSAHTDEIIEWLPKLISIEEPIGTLVLFSSRRQMQEVASRLPKEYQNSLLIQNETPKAVLIQTHHEKISQHQPSIIFGLDSFAEGLDLPGDACVQVIIAKLPFSMPDNPIEKTKNRWIEQRGGNPFIEVTVPEASIKLIQAVGRLIRTENDYGRITILDNRLKTKSYGKKLLSNLPPFKRIS